MLLDASKLKAAALSVLMEHIGLAAYPIADEFMDAYVQQATMKFRTGDRLTFLPWLVADILTEKLPAALPIKDIAQAITTTYQSSTQP